MAKSQPSVAKLARQARGQLRRMCEAAEKGELDPANEKRLAAIQTLQKLGELWERADTEHGIRICNEANGLAADLNGERFHQDNVTTLEATRIYNLSKAYIRMVDLAYPEN